jgi:hypothetical protein
MKQLLFILILFSQSIIATSQDNSGVKMMLTMDGQDTAVIKRFDENQNLIFHKIFPQYGISQILAWTYKDNVLQSYTWSHSNIGFVESEYEYDSLNNIVNIYSYELDNQEKLKDLMSYHSINSLKKSEEFKLYTEKGVRYLKSTQYMKNGKLIKELEYDFNGRVDTIYYKYDNGLLINRKHIYGHNGAYNELNYTYDEAGNEISLNKVFGSNDTSSVSSDIQKMFGSNDTSFVIENIYDNGLLIKSTFYEDGKINSVERYKYSKGKLVSIKKEDADGNLKISSEYKYRKDGRIDYMDYVNNYMGQIRRTYYYYW